MKKTIIGASLAALAFTGLVAMPAGAAGDASLTGSNFEIEANANIKVDAASPSIDWANVTEVRQGDLASGGGDDSFGNGTKEDTAVPSVIDGSIPPNKSDLKWFGGYKEGDLATGFLHLYWSRVQDPSGTTNMDFELNKSSVLSSNGKTYVRSVGDLLITYDLENGGTRATISKRTWDGSKWGGETAFGDGDAVGTINTTAIAAGDADGLGAHSTRTFGEASIRLAPLLGGGGGTTACTTFGSAYLKSRSSAAFNSAVKDFIAPVTINISNCGQVNIVKVDDAGNPLAGAVFTLYQNDVATALTCTTASTGLCTISSVPFGTYVAKETTTPAGHVTAADQPVVVSANTPTVTLNFTNQRQRGAIKVHKQYPVAGVQQNQAGVTFSLTPGGATGQTDANGDVCFSNLLFGSYTVHETVPANFTGEADKIVVVDTAASCADTTYVGETVTFTNTPLSELLVAFRPQVAGATNATISCVLGANAVTPDAIDTFGGWTRSRQYDDLAPGVYTCTVTIS